MVSQDRRSASTTIGAYDFNEDILPEDTIRARNKEDCEEDDELESMDQFRSQGNMGTGETTCRISGVDGLPSSLQERKYTIMVQCVRKEKGAWRIGPLEQKRSSLQMWKNSCNQAYAQRVV